MDGSEFILYTSRSRCLISIFPMENETELKQSIFAMGVYCCNLFSDGASFHSGGKHFGSTKLTSVQRIWKCLDGYILRRSCSLLRISMDQTAHRKCESNLAVQAKKNTQVLQHSYRDPIVSWPGDGNPHRCSFNHFHGLFGNNKRGIAETLRYNPGLNLCLAYSRGPALLTGSFCGSTA